VAVNLIRHLQYITVNYLKLFLLTKSFCA